MMTEGIEEQNVSVKMFEPSKHPLNVPPLRQWQKANEDYKSIQNAIVCGKQFELYADGQRLVPADIKPVADKRTIEVEPFAPEMMGLGHRRTSGTGKRKRGEADDLDLFESGFQTAGGRQPKASKQKAVPYRSAFKSEEDEVEEIFKLSPEDNGRLSKEETFELDRFSRKPSIQAAQPARTRTASLATNFVSTSIISSSSTNNGVLRTGSRRSIGSSSRIFSLLSIFRAGQEMSADSKIYKAWENITYPAFKNSSVEWWPDEKAGSGRDRSFRSFRLAEEDRQSYDPGIKMSSRITACSRIKDTIGVMSDAEDSSSEAGRPLDAASMSDEELPELPTLKSAVRKKRRTPPRLPEAESEAEEDGPLPSLPRLLEAAPSSPKERPVFSSSRSASRQFQPAQPSLSENSSCKISSVRKEPIVIEIEDDHDDESIMFMFPKKQIK